jgi:hypothetical protein
VVDEGDGDAVEGGEVGEVYGSWEVGGVRGRDCWLVVVSRGRVWLPSRGSMPVGCMNVSKLLFLFCFDGIDTALTPGR